MTPGHPPGLKPGTLIVLEGLDQTGKSTQSRELQRFLEESTTMFAHLPEGFDDFTRRTYHLLESNTSGPKSGLARQLAHLACHAEAVPEIAAALRDRAVVLDRWWWSSIAYGWYGGDIEQASINHQTYTALVQGVWQPVTASVVFLFDTPFETDPNNSARVRAGYDDLARANADLTVRVPKDAPDNVTAYLLDQLRRRDLLTD